MLTSFLQLLKKFLLAALGILFLALGILGTLIPVLPGVSFLLMAALCFGLTLPRWLARLRHQSHQRLVHRRR